MGNAALNGYPAGIARLSKWFGPLESLVYSTERCLQKVNQAKQNGKDFQCGSHNVKKEESVVIEKMILSNIKSVSSFR